MELRFNKTGYERKALVKAISEITGTKAKYLGAPGFSYLIGSYTVSKDGTLDTKGATKDEVSFLLSALAGQGFAPAEAANMQDESIVLAIELAPDEFSDAALTNLKKLVAGKEALIKRALGTDLASSLDSLPIILQDGKVRFLWFRFGMDAESIAAWSYFLTMLCKTAKSQKRVIIKEKALAEGESEKFAMRCFLLKLGFIGDEYKAARKIILSGLTGCGSYKCDKQC